MKHGVCSLWLTITDANRVDTDYRVKTVYPPGLSVRRILFKYVKGSPVSLRYTVDLPKVGHCTCTCPDWVQRKQKQDCKHILALRANDLLNRFSLEDRDRG